MKPMDYNELYKKYQALLIENKKLKANIAELERTFDKPEPDAQTSLAHQLSFAEPIEYPKSLASNKNLFMDTASSEKRVYKNSSKEEKIALFMSLFKGRNDVYAQRWQNKKGQSGYSPVCSNEWIPGVCKKPKIKCSGCPQKSYSPLNQKSIEQHLLGETVIGIYPMNLNESCWFMVIDFDKDGWGKDIAVLRKVCIHFEIPIAVERSRSGNGGHVWFFFNEEISASKARTFGTSLLSWSMEKRHTISFRSYDRLFPNQDTMPKGGFGNLIALPLQKEARKNNNSLFINSNSEAYKDQWAFLSGIKKISENELIAWSKKMNGGNELGTLKNYDKEDKKPWKRKMQNLGIEDFPDKVEIVKSAMLYIKKEELNSKVLNTLQRFAAFKNPEFYKAQAMRMSTYNKPRVISCSENFETYLALPRGCEDDVFHLFRKHKTKLFQIDETNPGIPIAVKFNGILRDEQQSAINELTKHQNGVLSATTAFGKTVVGANLISVRKVNTIILVHRQQLMLQWKERLQQFLTIDEKLPEQETKRGRKKKMELIGQLGSGKNQLNFVIDIAIMQSIYAKGEVNERIKNYGMVIVDECHHVPAFSFEQILKKASAKYVYGLTATPVRPDGHHPIIFFYCGPIRYEVDAKSQAETRPFEHLLIPRFTSFKIGTDKKQDELTIQEIYSELIDDDTRNQLIVDDIFECYKNGRNSLVLSGRVAHVEILTKILKKRIPDVISLSGGLGNKKTNELLTELSEIPESKSFVLVATGSFIGEGFDEPRLDTLFLTMPIAWKGTLQQYAGRLHRLHDKKVEVQIFDYVDVHVKVLERMYAKRLKGYANIGYKAKAEIDPGSPTNVIFDKQSFFPIYLNDIQSASKQVLIISPFITKKRVEQMVQYFTPLVKKQIEVTIVTRPTVDFAENKRGPLEIAFLILEEAGISLIFKSKIHQKFAIIDQKICWYGSTNLLSFGWSEESMMRIVSGNIAYELEGSLI